MKKTLIAVLVFVVVSIAGVWLKLNYDVASRTKCSFYKLVVTGECVCSEGYKKFYIPAGPYCATDSQKPCTSVTDCPDDEDCVSEDGESWFCTEGTSGHCYFRKSVEESTGKSGKICVD